MATNRSNLYKRLAQEAKATAISDALFSAGIKSADMANATEEQWAMAAQAGQTKPASEETRALVLTYLKVRERATEMSEAELFAPWSR